MYHIYICDDDRTFASMLSSLLPTLCSVPCEIETFHSVEAFTGAVRRNRPDIALLDIEVDSDNGIEMAKKLFPERSSTQVIYITGYAEYCTDVYETEHIYFLLKPLKEKELKKALDKAINCLQKAEPLLIVRTNEQVYAVALSDIYYIESKTRKVLLHTADGVHTMTGKITGLPEEIQSRLIHCHKSFLVNPLHVKAILSPSDSFNHFFQMDNGEKVSISQARWQESRHQFLDVLTREATI